MSFKVYLHHYQNGNLANADRTAVLNVLRRYDCEGPDSDGRYTISFPDSTCLVFQAYGREGQDSLPTDQAFTSCFVDFTNFGEDVLRFLWEVARAGDFVIMPRNTDLSHDANRLLLLVGAEQEEHLWDPRAMRQSFRIRLVSSLDELREALTRGGPMDRSIPRPRNTTPRMPTPKDVAFVDKCLDRYFARLPDELRVGVALPRRYDVVGFHRSYLIPWDMWDGKPDEQGYVRWKRLTIRPQAFTPAMGMGHGDCIPDLLMAYLQSQAVGRMLLRDGSRSLLLPATPNHTGRCWDFHRNLGDERAGLLERADFLPFAASEDESILYCVDRRGLPVGEDGPVVALSAEAVFRLTPRLLSAPDPRSLAAALAQPVYGSIRELLMAGCPRSENPWREGERSGYLREVLDVPAPFDWSPWLTPEPPLDQEAPAANADAIDPKALADHLDRITGKLAFLRRMDPAYILPGSEYHHHLMNPPLLLAERASFQKEENVRLPEVYARFLMKVGNGGIGPWQGLERLEHSAANFTALWEGAKQPDAGRLGRPFPHRRAWYPELKGTHRVVHPEDLAPRHVQGTVLLSRASGQTLRLVVSGPERGHVWSDERPSVRGLHPVVRGGPYSFLAWYEGEIDKMLALVGPSYNECASEIRRMFERQAKEKAKVRTPDSAYLQRHTDALFGELIWEKKARQWTGQLEISGRVVPIELDPCLNPTPEEQREIIERWRGRVDGLRAAEPEFRRLAAADAAEAMRDYGCETELPQEEFANGLELERISLMEDGVLYYRDPQFFEGNSIAVYFNADLSFERVEIG